MTGRGTRTLAAVAAVATAPALPAWALATALHPRWRRDWPARWGLEVAPIPPGAVWIHGASVGEIGAASALLPHLDGPILLTADTDTGARVAREVAAGAGNHVVAAVRPVDHPWTLAPLWADARPRAVVFVESAWWPQLAALAVRTETPVARVGARPGRGTRRWGPLWGMTADGTAVIIAQDHEAATWYRRHGAREVYVGGDLKGDRPLPPNPLRWSRPFLAAASTREGDEVAVLDAVATLPEPRLALLLAPRHPERFDAVADLLTARGLSWTKRSHLAGGRVPDEVDVLLLDTLGELASCLQGAAAAFVGGSFDPAVGGHSPAEAVRAGVPVVCGPHVWANAAGFRGATVFRAGTDGLAAALRRACAAPRPIPSGNGSGARTARALEHWLEGRAAPEHPPRPWARPLTPLWGLGAAARKAGATLGRPEHLDVPVIAVGSPNARGPGRTSTTRWVADQLRLRGHRVGIAVRGYGRTRAGREVRASWHTLEAADLGDEGAMLARSGHWIAAGPDRVAAARCLAEAGATAVVVDDGLGSHGLVHDVDLLVVDARFPTACGLLPAGYRREWATVPPWTTGVVVHHAGERGAAALVPGAAVARRLPGPWYRGERPSEPPRGPVAAVVGIARPADFLSTLEVPVARIRVLRDHQPIGPELAMELQQWAGDLPLVCTAKDHPRLPPSTREVAYWRDVDLEVEGYSEAWFPPFPR